MASNAFTSRGTPQSVMAPKASATSDPNNLVTSPLASSSCSLKYLFNPSTSRYIFLSSPMNSFTFSGNFSAMGIFSSTSSVAAIESLSLAALCILISGSFSTSLFSTSFLRVKRECAYRPVPVTVCNSTPIPAVPWAVTLVISSHLSLCPSSVSNKTSA